ncbi:MAG: hypothetical protein AAF483_24690, partial [Planctomycetota bacterium]
MTELFTGCVLPALVSLICWLFWSRFVFRGMKSHPRLGAWAISSSLLLGFVSGYAFLKIAPWSVSSHWHWMPYCLIYVALILPVAQLFRDRSLVLTWISSAILFVPVAYLLTPKWELELPAGYYIAMIVMLMSVVAMCFGNPKSVSKAEPVSEVAEGGEKGNEDEREARTLLARQAWGHAFVMAATALATIVLVFLSGSLRFTQLMMLGASCFAAVVWSSSFRAQIGLAGAWFATLIVGMLYVAQVNSFS